MRKNVRFRIRARFGLFQRILSVKWHNGHFHVQYMAFTLRGWRYGPDLGLYEQNWQAIYLFICLVL